ncbi:hypothetical protein [Mycoplasma todarodis]|nr:hypothetical protein [Mycoplasma todarodis]
MSKMNSKAFGLSALAAGTVVALSTAVPFVILYQNKNKDDAKTSPQENASSKEQANAKQKEIDKLKQDLKDQVEAKQKEIDKLKQESKKPVAKSATGTDDLKNQVSAKQKEIDKLKKELDDLKAKNKAKQPAKNKAKQPAKTDPLHKYTFKNISNINVENGFMKEIGGTIYVGTKTNGLMKIEAGKLVNVDKTNVEEGFIEDVNGTIYVGTNSNGLMKLENDKLVPAVFEADGKTPDTDVVKNGFIKEINGVTYVAKGYNANENGLFKIVNSKYVLVDDPISAYDGGFMEEIDGVVYIGDGTMGAGLQIFKNGVLEPAVFDDNGAPDGREMKDGFIKKFNGEIYVGAAYNPDENLILTKMVNKKLKWVEAIYPNGKKEPILMGVDSKMIQINGKTLLTGIDFGRSNTPSNYKEMAWLHKGHLVPVEKGVPNMFNGFVETIKNVNYVGTSTGIYKMEKQPQTLPVTSIY